MRQVIVRVVQVLFALLAVSVAGATISNVLLDNAEVRDMAQAVACAGVVCLGNGPTRAERSPLGQSFAFQTKTHTTISVQCTRSAIVFGAYTCKRE